MDFRRLIKNGTYRKEDLTEEQQAFISGMEYAVETLGCCVDNITHVDDKITDKILNEIIREAAEDIKEWIYGEICARIVVMNDENSVND